MDSEEGELLDEPPIDEPLRNPQRNRRNDDEEDPLSLTNLWRTVYNNRYYWEIAKSVIIFALALKLANECRHIAIPMKDYEPFSYISVCTCR